MTPRRAPAGKSAARAGRVRCPRCTRWSCLRTTPRTATALSRGGPAARRAGVAAATLPPLTCPLTPTTLALLRPRPPSRLAATRPRPPSLLVLLAADKAVCLRCWAWGNARRIEGEFSRLSAVSGTSARSSRSSTRQCLAGQACNPEARLGRARRLLGPRQPATRREAARTASSARSPLMSPTAPGWSRAWRASARAELLQRLKCGARLAPRSWGTGPRRLAGTCFILLAFSSGPRWPRAARCARQASLDFSTAARGPLFPWPS